MSLPPVCGEDQDNVYLREFLALDVYHGVPGGASAYERRRAGVRRYAFGIPNRAALEALALHAPIVELGAGTGYWAYLLRNRGVDIVAYDVAPPDLAPNAYQLEPRTWTTVMPGGVEVLQKYPERTLFLCWPGYQDSFADEALEAYEGKTMIYIGEGPGGHTANDAFFDRLQGEWHPRQQIALPRWPGAHDALTIYDRGHPLSTTM